MLLTLVGLLVFYGLTLRDGHRAGDFAMFAMHTKNLVEGHPYADTPFLWNPYTPSVGTAGYPAGTAILLSPVYAFAGLNLAGFKWIMILCFLGALLIFTQLFNDRLTPLQQWAWFLVVGLIPYFWDIKDNVQSDLPFLLFVALSLWCIHHLYPQGEQAVKWAWVLDTALALTLASMTRSAGFVLIPAFLVYDLWARKSWIPSRQFLISVGLFAVFFWLQGLYFHIEGGVGYGELVAQNLSSFGAILAIIVENVKYYILACTINIILENGYLSILKFGLAGTLFVLAALGFYRAARKEVKVVDVFTVAYLGLMILWPFRQPSYLIPIYPLLFYYAFLGWQSGMAFLPEKLNQPAAYVAIGLVLLSFGMRYTTMSSSLDQNVASPAAWEMYEKIQTQVPDGATIIARVPRSISLFANRSATCHLLPADDRERFNESELAENLAFFEQVGAQYVVTGPKGKDFHQEVLPLWYLVQDAAAAFEPLFVNDEFGLYKIKPATPREEGIDTEELQVQEN